MTPELWQHLKPLFNAALERSPEDRAAFVATACGDDVELRVQLSQLLDAEQQNTVRETHLSLMSKNPER